MAIPRRKAVQYRHKSKHQFWPTQIQILRRQHLEGGVSIHVAGQAFAQVPSDAQEECRVLQGQQREFLPFRQYVGDDESHR